MNETVDLKSHIKLVCISLVNSTFTAPQYMIAFRMHVSHAEEQ